MSNTVLRQSPFVYTPLKMTVNEGNRSYTRIDENFKPYTVIDVLTKVYHRSFYDDLRLFAEKYPEEFDIADSFIRHTKIAKLKIIRPESVFFQPVSEFYVDIFVDAQIRFDISDNRGICTTRRWDGKIRLRYLFDLRPCHMTCCFCNVIINENDALIYIDDEPITLDKYLLPYLNGPDYEILAEHILEREQKICLTNDAPFSPFDWIRSMGLELKYGVFPDNNTLGEYFFDHGETDLVNKETGEIYNMKVKPLTIILNERLSENKGILNSTATHEAVHHYLGIYFFLLQKTHGQGYCSYLCKRYSQQESHEGLTPIGIMELQANKLPGYLMIRKEKAKERAVRLILSYGYGRSLGSINRLVDDISAYYRTTKVVAKTRLSDMGFTEVNGLTQCANGSLVPPYVSTLKKGETYTIYEKDAIREYVENDDFGRILNSGKFIYAEGHFCLNNNKYVFKTSVGKYVLTSYARNHMKECCLVFKVSYQTAHYSYNGFLKKSRSLSSKSLKYVGFNGESVITEEGLRLRKMIEKEMVESSLMRSSFNQTTVNLMKANNMTISKLAEETGLSVETIKNLRSNNKMVFSIETIVAVCIAMHLPYSISKEYIEMSPCKFWDNLEMRFYEYALINWHELPLAEVNRKLVDSGIRPLTNMVEGYDENGKMLENA